MADHKDENERAGRGDEERTRDRAHSESQAHERVVRGTHSAAEGYSKGGTGAGDPLAGLRADEEPEEGGGTEEEEQG
ncbi:hypothetical protein [Streptomyces xiaopingdaonensis]|uniref:hypothetical protein n=1 Tax=Streptomyces xiaopingdaonensis TaxID=1565415 RepID=UPI0002FB2A0F|nr:hypothetical protein [Streptomyces xiaopingdaonensis]